MGEYIYIYIYILYIYIIIWGSLFLLIIYELAIFIHFES